MRGRDGKTTSPPPRGQDRGPGVGRWAWFCARGVPPLARWVGSSPGSHRPRPRSSVPWSAFVRRVVGQQVRRPFESKIFQDTQPVHFAAALASKCSCSARQRHKSGANVLEPGRTVNAPPRHTWAARAAAKSGRRKKSKEAPSAARGRASFCAAPGGARADVTFPPTTFAARAALQRVFPILRFL